MVNNVLQFNTSSCACCTTCTVVMSSCGCRHCMQRFMLPVSQQIAALLTIISRSNISACLSHPFWSSKVSTISMQLKSTAMLQGQGFAFLLRKPPAGPFYVTKQTLDQLRADLRGSSIGFKVCSPIQLLPAPA